MKEKIELMETDNMTNITEDVDVDVFVVKNKDKDFTYNLVVRVYKDGKYDGVGLTLADNLSTNVLKSIDFFKSEKFKDFLEQEDKND